MTETVTPEVQSEAEVDVSFDQAVEEEREQPTAVNDQPVEEEDVVDILEPKAEVRQWVIGKGDIARTYTQRPLSFIQKMQWFSLVGEVLDKAMSGDDALTVGNLMSAPQTRGGQLTASDFRDADTFVQAVGKLLSAAPEFLQDSYCIWLAIPDYERGLVKEIMALPEDEGGLSDEDGIEIIEVFIDQNYEALNRFFRERLGQLQKRISQRAQEAVKEA